MTARTFLDRGWCRFASDAVLASWVARTRDTARAAVHAPANAKWLRCGGTWFAGVNALPSDASGAVENGVPIGGRAVDFVHRALGLTGIAWDRAQVSVVYPGYPRPMASESAAAYRYRLQRDAAHVDGVLRVGPQRRRYVREHHAFILGIPMTDARNGASPLVVWEGSHHIVRRALRDFFGDLPCDDWRDEDVTTLYHATRREVFDRCARVAIAARPGEAYLVHRLALHGIAPWAQGASADPDGRMIVYFRPDIGHAGDWLLAP